MKKIYLVFLLGLLAVYMSACSSSNDSSSNTDNGNGNGGTSDKSKILNVSIRTVSDKDNRLINTFFTPAVATNGGELTYSWDFDDGSGYQEKDNNLVTYTYKKYGKDYKVQLKVKNISSGMEEETSIIVPLGKPAISFDCVTAGLNMQCTPSISEPSIKDIDYKWEIYDESGSILKKLSSKGSNSISHTFTSDGLYKIKLEGRSSLVVC